MDSRAKNICYALIIVLGLGIIAALLYIIPFRYGINNTVTYTPTDEPLDNPLTGYAPPAENEEECEDSQLVFINLTWAQWEPKEGVYDTAALEERFHIARWKSEHKHAVLRFVCDNPGDALHIDIPTWLYRLTRDGAYYDTSYGKGYCPNYANAIFRERHAEAIAALANYFNQDDFLSYVELGSLGHWGEWHIKPDEGLPLMPDAEICDQYVLDYSDHFTNARLLTRRNYSIAVDGGLGIYNDMAGDTAETREWLDWMKNGGSYETAGEELIFTPVDKIWERAPVGGEFMSDIPVSELLDGMRFRETLNTVEQSHMTFIGANCPTGAEKDSEQAQSIRERLGYHLYISELRTEYSFAEDCVKVYLTWKNTGLAPLYFDWPATLYIYDINEDLKYWETIDVDLTTLAPGKTVETESSIPFTDLFRQGYQLGVGIKAPDEHTYVRLAMEGEERDGVRIIYTFVDKQ